MSYNTPVTSKTQYGVVEVGTNIDVTSGVIDLPQSVDTTADVIFNTVTSSAAVTDSGNRVITTLTAGTNITINGTAPSLTINASNTPVYSIVSIDETDSPYTVLPSDYYIGVVANAPVIINLLAGTDGDTLVIKSEFNNLGDITINANGTELIEGSSSFVVPFVTLGSVTLIYRANNWNII